MILFWAPESFGEVLMHGRSELLARDGGHWSESEVDPNAFKDARLGRRCTDLLRRLSDRVGGTIPLACQDRANTKAAYRFFANPKVEEGEILSGHLEATRVRYAANDGPILLLQDTTEFTYQRRNPHDVGFTKAINSGRDKDGRLRHHALCGILMHSSLAVTEDGLPLGLAAIKFWNREKFKGTAQLKRKINPTRVPIEVKESIRWLDNLRQSLALLGQPERCVHIGDRESDIYELYCLAKDLVRILSYVRWSTVSPAMATIRCRPRCAQLNVRGRIPLKSASTATMSKRVTFDIRYKRIHVCPPIGKQNRYPSLDLTIVHASELHAPSGRKPIQWKLVTDLEVNSLKYSGTSRGVWPCSSQRTSQHQ